MSDSEDFLIFVFDVCDDRDAVLNVLTEKFEYHKTDANIRFRHMPGMLREHFPRERAQELAGALNAIGCHAKVVEGSKLPDLKHAAQIHHLRCVDSGLEVVNADGSVSETLSWESINLVTVGAIPSSTVDGSPTIHPNAAATDHADPVTHPEKFAMELWVVANQGQLFFRAEQHEMNYEYLGDRKVSSTKGNLELLVRDILEKASHLLVLGTTRDFLNHRPLKTYAFSTPDDLRDLVAGQVAVVLEMTTDS